VTDTAIIEKVKVSEQSQGVCVCALRCSSLSMASTSSENTKHSRFSTFKVFKFTGSKPPPPPPKDPNYIYPSSGNPSLLSLSSSRPPQRKPSTRGTLSVRTPSPAPSRTIQPSPSASVSASTLLPDQSPGTAKKRFFHKISGLRKRSASKSSRVSIPDDTTDDEGISRPWNFQVSGELRFDSFHSRHDLDLFLSSFSFLFIFSLRARAYNLSTTYTHTHARIYAHLAPYTHRRVVRSHVFRSSNGI
jgi:hypothetical protein